MKIEKIHIDYPFSLGSFLYAKIGLEASVTPEDNIEECYKELSRKAKELAAFEQGAKIEVNPAYAHLLQEYPTTDPPVQFNGGKFVDSKPQPISLEDKISKPPFESIQEGIESSTSITVLKTFHFLIEKNKKLTEEEKKKLWIIYDEKAEKLSKATSK
jgi:hypothetical protein